MSLAAPSSAPEPSSERIHLSSPDVTQAEETALVRAFRSGWIAPLGPEVDAFEAELARHGGRECAVALSSGTAALHLGLLTLGVRPGDVVVTATMTFAATVNAIVYTGARPLLVDCDDTGTMSVELLGRALEQCQRDGRRVAAVVPVDLLGKVADHEGIAAVAGEHGIPVLSDAAESLGARRGGRAAESFGQAAVVSFNGNKIATTSGGGALLTDDVELAALVRHLATQARQPVAHYEHLEVGYNYRLSNLLAALGRAQLERLPAMIERRRQHRHGYRRLFEAVPGVTIFGEPAESADADTRDNYWLTSILVDSEVAGFTPEQLRLALDEQDIEARPLWKPMHRQPAYRGFTAVVDGTADALFATGLSLPSGSVLTDAQMRRVHGAIGSFLSEHAHG